MNHHKLHAQMNSLGRRRQPFLWGITYDMERGFISPEPFDDSEVLWHVGDDGNHSHLEADRKPEMQIRRHIGIESYGAMFEIGRASCRERVFRAV